MITSFKILILTLLLSVHSSASFFGNVKAHYYEQNGDYYYEDKNYSEALENYIDGCNNNSAFSCFQLFAMYSFGQGTPKDQYKADQMLQKSVELGYPMAEVILAKKLLFMKNKNVSKALELLESAASKESAEAYEMLYKMYSLGYGVKKDIVKAGQYYRLAKANGIETKGFQSAKSATSAQLIIQIQSGLKRLGFYKSSVDGISGPMTRKSIADFQKFYGYPVDSSVSESTLKQINNELK